MRILNRYHDITVPISSRMHIWPSHKSIQIKAIKSIDAGASSNVTAIKINTHTGTHIDAPYHMLSGEKTIDQIPLEILIGPVQVIEILDRKEITAAELKSKLKNGTERVLFKTRNSERWSEEKFFRNYVYLSLKAAEFLAEMHVKLVGIDYLSIDKYGDKRHLPHKALLSRDIVIIEGINLSKIHPGFYELICLPLKIEGADGAPARVILKETQT
ncbi:hypothetical protein AMJ44_02505 [candidate division WOR-1 bacterium DG_54_3]|uniref:Kynurenine formamidase n=1 Tax=candidate division WOR-1 bacterium DG_54_3 TaxID=1703775 RepID=A0A0S7Y5A5_UNCSA|nr:MAG: hypothetical protein AMJ44_02505 [candidate division WOR-1 bacterium DG_54_3]